MILHIETIDLSIIIRDNLIINVFNYSKNNTFCIMYQIYIKLLDYHELLWISLWSLYVVSYYITPSLWCYNMILHIETINLSIIIRDNLIILCIFDTYAKGIILRIIKN